MEGKFPANYSWSGRSLMKSVQNMAKGVGRAIGDGRCNNIIEEIWARKHLITFHQDLQDQLPTNQYGCQT